MLINMLTVNNIYIEIQLCHIFIYMNDLLTNNLLMLMLVLNIILMVSAALTILQ